MGMDRPSFDEIKNFAEFSKYYWYRDELIKICKAHGLKAPSGKIELYQVIEAYFSGDEILPEKIVGKAEVNADNASILKNQRASVAKNQKPGEVLGSETMRKASGEKKSTVAEFTRETGLIECGFTFGPRFREFFVKQTGEEKFKFNVDMVATAKKVKETGDENFTLGDLLDVYYGKQTYATYDKSALQWNRFVHDFCADDATKGFKNRLKAAAALWKMVRDSDREKKYSRALLEEFRKEL